MTASTLAVLSPEIKYFIGAMIVCGPLGIFGLILILKKIQKKNPDRIRWR